MNTERRLNRAFENAIELPLSSNTKYVLMSDCHRGTGNSSDNFLKNQHIYFAALNYYYQNHFTYIELGDGDELWENTNYRNIIDIHSDVFWLFSKFYRENRFYMLFGNHDMEKQQSNFTSKNVSSYFCTSTQQNEPLLPDITFHEAIILRSKGTPEKSLYLTHGHQASTLNYNYWKVARFLVRNLWRPLELRGVNDPTSAAKDYKIKTKTEERLNHWATVHQHKLIAGHTHRPILSTDSPYYCNTGSCVHPRCITGIEVEHLRMTLIKWYMNATNNGNLYIERKVLAGPISI